MTQRKGRHPMSRGSQGEFPACHQVENFRAAPELDHHGANATAVQSVRPGAQCGSRVRHFHDHQPVWVKPQCEQSGRKNFAPFEGRKILLHPDQPFVFADGAAGEGESKTRSSNSICYLGRKNFMQGGAFQPAAKACICCGMAQRTKFTLRAVTLVEAPAQVRRDFLLFQDHKE